MKTWIMIRHVMAQPRGGGDGVNIRSWVADRISHVSTDPERGGAPPVAMCVRWSPAWRDGGGRTRCAALRRVGGKWVREAATRVTDVALQAFDVCVAQSDGKHTGHNLHNDVAFGDMTGTGAASLAATKMLQLQWMNERQGWRGRGMQSMYMSASVAPNMRGL